MVAGLPGIILAFTVIWKVKDTRAVPPGKERPKVTEYLKLLKNKPFFFVCLAQAMGTFTLGGLAAWMPTYFHRYFDFNIAQAGTVFGVIVIAAGALGTLLGGVIADKMFQKTNKAYFITAAASFVIALPFGVAALLCPFKIPALILLSAAVVFIFLQTGPLQAAIVSTTRLKIRSMAFALNIFIIHALGDALSPAVIGKLSDIYSLKLAVFISLLFVMPAAVFALTASRFYTPLKDSSPQ
jgi:sugar phosphate permease